TVRSFYSAVFSNLIITNDKSVPNISSKIETHLLWIYTDQRSYRNYTEIVIIDSIIFTTEKVAVTSCDTQTEAWRHKVLIRYIYPNSSARIFSRNSDTTVNTHFQHVSHICALRTY